jgi:hypothetical protein
MFSQQIQDFLGYRKIWLFSIGVVMDTARKYLGDMTRVILQVIGWYFSKGHYWMLL